MRVLVLGGTSFVGRAIVATLLRHHEVGVLNRGRNPIWQGRAAQLTADRNDPASVRRALTGGYDCVVDVSAMAGAHIDSTSAPLRALGVRRYVHISSGVVYDSASTPVPFREDAPVPGDARWGRYGIGKAEAEQRLRRLDFPELTVLRPPYVYGPHNNDQREQFLWARLLGGRPVFVPGTGGTRIQFCPVEHLADVVLAACDGAIPAGTFNVAEARSYPFDDYVRVLADVASVEPDIVHVTDPAVNAIAHFPFFDYEMLLDTTALERTAAPAPVDLATGLTAALAWFRAHGKIEFRPTAWEAARAPGSGE
ncbi:NAD-dependent epimerase/dehydratase family protein [Hamadaea tsunoensis]|uniref:NAD-dependent epimerase/dehydratase family protein n=1 Tax=Hamadaea tsunoensis TaxID=53368 RepID=UPI00146FBA68|nr:NAD-dependent epimerase/dehydratase family protein [Hamadaea tsunoensis]